MNKYSYVIKKYILATLITLPTPVRNMIISECTGPISKISGGNRLEGKECPSASYPILLLVFLLKGGDPSSSFF